MALGKTRVRALGAAVGDLDGAKQLPFQALGALLVELLVGLAERGERDAELFDRRRYGVEQALASLGCRVGHRG